MRARGAIVGAVVIAVIALLVIAIGGGGSAPYRAAAVFDTAEGMVPGQLVKIAGARVGTVTAVKLLGSQPTPHAVIEFTIARRLAPFHADASCQILPEGPISEYFVECDPGSSSKPALRAATGVGVPTVPLARTAVPVSLQDLLNIFSLPVDERLAVLINALGIGTAGRGTDINAILRRANPALVQGDRVLSILDAQHAEIAAAVTQTRAVLGQLASRHASVRAFIDNAAVVAETVAANRSALQAGVQRLPRLLALLRTNLGPVDRLATEGTPLLADLQASGPGLARLTHTLPAFIKLGGPAVSALGRASQRGIPAVTAASPVVAQLARLGTVSPGVLRLLDQLLVSSRDSGAFEGLLQLLYSLATDSGGYDSTSHYVTALIVPFPTCIAAPAALGCSHAYDSPGQGSIPIDDAAAGPQSTTAVRGPRRASAHQSAAAVIKSLAGYLLK